MTVTRRGTGPACATCGAPTLKQDPDMLDTWFSSALWPFSTLGWPEERRTCAVLPEDVMETGYDIIFFWVARMIISGLASWARRRSTPSTCTALVRDERGQKMSKTKGNVLDPLDVTDRLRHGRAALHAGHEGSPGNDLKLSAGRMEANRNFANKLWNAARFVLANITPDAIARDVDGSPAAPEHGAMALADRWIVGRLHTLEADVARLLDGYLLGEAGRQIYDFLWGDLADWYIEAAKPRLQGSDASVGQTLAYTLERALAVAPPVYALHHRDDLAAPPAGWRRVDRRAVARGRSH